VSKNHFSRNIPVFLLLSGFCALIYQTVWLREFRLIFGSSTAATAAVLGVFMGGLGAGSAYFGKRIERSARPLKYYATLEVLIAISAAITPLILWLARSFYVATGGSFALGMSAGTLLRLILSALVLIIPTFLMGGTFPAAAKAFSSDEDSGRRSAAFLYGCNTLGAVLGTLFSTFLLLEIYGNQRTLWLGCGLNMVVAIFARVADRKLLNHEIFDGVSVGKHHSWQNATAPVYLIIGAAFVVGLAFMIMELVWYRMLSPILGGTTFTFGLILAIALFGIGLGGLGYSKWGSKIQPTLRLFALTCAFEAFVIAIPYALGDRLALWSLILKQSAALGFGAEMIGWAAITATVALPASIVAGFQFPMLIALLGKGEKGVAQHSGATYAANTAGAIMGSLMGGFGLLPLLTAPGLWKATCVLLISLAIVCLAFTKFKENRMFNIWVPAFAVLAIVMLLETGPTSAWRHSGIGAGRAPRLRKDLNSAEDWLRTYRSAILWEAEGVESSVALYSSDAFAFVVNGKIDGNIRGDAGTQVMSGMIGAMLHSKLKTAMVIGLGTGSTAGWLGQVPSVEKIDVIELEPSIREIAKFCSPANFDVCSNPKVHIHTGDAREALLVSKEKYDLVFSEPSNPYRAGIASLFTEEFYEAATKVLNENGLFIQWVQSYEVDGETIRTIFRTIGRHFPWIEVWTTQRGDMLLVGSIQKQTWHVPSMRDKAEQEPFRSALRNVWRVEGVEGLFSHFLANQNLADWIVKKGGEVATDDLNPLEFGFARAVGKSAPVSMFSQVVESARARGWDRPNNLSEELKWHEVEIHRMAREFDVRSAAKSDSSEVKKRAVLFSLYQKGSLSEAREKWNTLKFEPINPVERIALANIFSDADDQEFNFYLEKVRLDRLSDALALEAIRSFKKKDGAKAIDQFVQAADHWHQDVWSDLSLISQCLNLALEFAKKTNDPMIARRLYQALEKPFSGELYRIRRLDALVELSRIADTKPTDGYGLKAIELYQEHYPWNHRFLKYRALLFQINGDPRQFDAIAELEHFNLNQIRPFADGELLPKTAVNTESDKF
jgi:spermidine synthase